MLSAKARQQPYQTSGSDFVSGSMAFRRLRVIGRLQWSSLKPRYLHKGAI